MMAFSRLSRYGMTFGLLTDDLGEELLTWFRAGFHARISAPPAEVPDSTENGRASGEKWPGSLAKYDPDSRSWKTAQFSLLGDLEPFSETWPRWGMTAGGEFYPLPTPERRTSENESGLLLPTPQARDHFPAQSQEYIAEKKSQGHGMSNLNDHVRWQTPVADDSVNRENGKINSRGEPKLSAQVKLWPTPTVDGNYNRKGASAKSGDGLATAVGGVKIPPTYPTPTAVTNTGGAALCKWGGSGARAQLRKVVTPEELNGSLNPEWVEWLMGWPLGWTDLKPLETDRFQQWLDSHGKP
jgi:hypothetical protein